MSTMTNDAVETPVRQSITVNARPDQAFKVFTSGFDSWWPRSHHIGKSPMKKAIIEERAGGRCYTEQIDGTECDWGSILIWEPPRRFVMAWQIRADWQFEPDIAKSSEVEVIFTPVGKDSTRVDLEHRHFERLGAGGPVMRAAVGKPDGWGGLLQLFAERVSSLASGA